MPADETPPPKINPSQFDLIVGLLALVFITAAWPLMNLTRFWLLERRREQQRHERMIQEEGEALKQSQMPAPANR